MGYTFTQYKEAFHKWAAQFGRRALQIEIDEIEELRTWETKSEEEFLAFIKEKVHPHLAQIQIRELQPRILDLMIEGAALKAPDFTEFLMALKEEEFKKDQETFFDYLQLFCTYL